jgi:imidazolonepropionase
LRGAAEKGGRRVEAADLGQINDGCFVELGGRIAWVGRRRDLPPEFAGRSCLRVDLGGRCALPAFVESHTHLVYAGSRADEFESRCQGATYQEIAGAGGGILATVRATRAASLAALARGAQERADAFARQGVATLEAKSGYALDAAGEVKLLEALGRVRGPRVVRTFLGAHAIPPEAGGAASHLAAMAALFPEIRRRKLASRVDAFIEAGYFEPALAEGYLVEALRLGFAVAAHAEQLTHSGGAKLAARLGARSVDHLVRVDDADAAALAASETTCVLLPAADLYMDCPYPPARKLIEAGARVALATDLNPGSSPTLDLSLVGVLARARMKMSLPEVITAYTVAGAHALGLGEEVGALTPGRRCDFAVLSGSWRDLFYSVGHAPVAATARDGALISGGLA